MRRTIVAVLVLATCVAACASGQAVSVYLRDIGTSRPLAGAITSLVDSGGRVADERLSDASGRVLLTAPHSGRYRVRVRRIGVVPFMSEAFGLGEKDRRTLPLWLPGTPISLASIRSMGRQRGCRGGAELQRTAADVWTAIMLALRTSELSATSDAIHTTTRGFDRWVPLSGRGGTARDTTFGEGGAIPFASFPVAQLSANGWVQQDDRGRHIYAGPDAHALLSDEFAADHCFSVVLGSGDRSGLVGLRFVPTRERKKPEIAGTAWADTGTAELRRIDFRYVNLRLPAPAPDAGGEVEFERLPSGGWIVKRWVLRMPAFDVFELPRASVTSDAPRFARLTGYREAGGVALVQIDARPLLQSAPPSRAGRGTVHGLVLDAAGVPLVNATIRLAAAHMTASTDENGAFVLEDAPAGPANIEILPMDAGKARSAVREIAIEARATTSLVIRLPER